MGDFNMPPGVSAPGILGNCPDDCPVGPVWIHPEDAVITRHGDCAELGDMDGIDVASFPPSWTDDHILAALDIANRAYAAGHSAGRTHKADEIRRAIWVE